MMHRVILLLFICCTTNVWSQFENLGRDIEENVQNSLRNFNIDLQSRVADFQEKVNREIDTNVAPLEGLGKRIQEQVYKSLEPVRAMELQHKMINGIGGTTITYINNEPTLIIENGNVFICTGQIIDTPQPKCEGNKEKYVATNDKSFCLSGAYSQINDQLCISSTNSGILFSYTSSDIYKCTGANGEPVLQITTEDYKKLCGNRLPWQAKYKYFANPSDPEHVEIPNSNNALKCLNDERDICIFDSEWPRGGNAGNTFVQRSVVVNREFRN